MKETFALVASYLLGSVPIGLLLVRWRKGIDIREVGSGNIGATNVWRAAGPSLGVPAFLLDCGKGVGAVLLGRWAAPDSPLFHVLAGLAAIIGNNWSAFLRLKGGKGVSISLGVIITLQWQTALAAFGVWAVVILITRYISVGSMAAGISTPLLMYAFHAPLEYEIFAIVVAAFILFRHRANLRRLIRGKESRFQFSSLSSAPKPGSPDPQE